jgi:N-acetylneuraminic acid mutarotase
LFFCSIHSLETIFGFVFINKYIPLKKIDMKKLFTLISFLGFLTFTFAQQLPNLPLPLGAGNAEVWNGSIYHFGGSNNWSGSIVYPRIYKFDGSNWTYYDSIPDNNLWDVETTLVGDDVYLLGGWPSGPTLNRKYNLTTGDWVSLAPSPNTSQTWGITAEEINGVIYLFNSTGNVYAYTIATDTWETKTSNVATGFWAMSSILFQGEIYILGWNNSAFYKYSPALDTWTQLADSPYQVGSCAFGIINNLIYCIGGNSAGQTIATYKSIIDYDINTDLWVTDALELSTKRHWMATAVYKGGLYVVGGIDSLAQAVDVVEEIIPQGTAVSVNELQSLKGYKLEQNYPNPLRNSTKIKYSLPAGGYTTLKMYDVLGTERAILVDEVKPAGSYEVSFNASSMKNGVYYYRLKSGKFIQSKKILIQN